jgi:hypothetical protein
MKYALCNLRKEICPNTLKYLGCVSGTPIPRCSQRDCYTFLLIKNILIRIMT